MAGCYATGDAPGTRPCEPGGIGGYGRGIGEGQEPVVGPDQGGASVSEGEAAVWVCQGALLPAGEEHGTVGAAVRTGQPACGAGTTEGVVGPEAIIAGLPGCIKLKIVPPRGRTRQAECQRRSPGCQYSLTRRALRYNTDRTTPCPEYPKKDAERMLPEILQKLETGSFLRPSRLTVSEYLA